MAGDVVNIKVCSPHKLCSVLTGNYHAICHLSVRQNYTALIQTKTYKNERN